jgi:hypothetical protein
VLAVAGTRARRFAKPDTAVPDVGGSGLTLLAVPARGGFTLLWPSFFSPTDGGWRLAFASGATAVGEPAALPGQFPQELDPLFESAAMFGAPSGRITVLYTVPALDITPPPGLPGHRLLAVDLTA